MMMLRKLTVLTLLTTLPWTARCTDSSDGFTQADRERLVRMEAILDQHDKRFVELRSTSDNRFEELRSDMRNTMMLFGGMVVAIFGFALWDRRTMVRPFETRMKEVDSAMERLREEKTARSVLAALRDLSKTDTRLA
jgi:hypothetical protein